MMHPYLASPTTGGVDDLVRAGLLELGDGCEIHSTAVFLPGDLLGTLRPIVLGDHVSVGAFAVIHGGAQIGAGVRVGHHVILGEPEVGYAMREVYPGAGAGTVLGAGVIVRAGAILYAGVTVGENATIGHHALLRTGVQVGADSQLAANVTVERGTRIGARVRVSPASHLTGQMRVGDGAYVGAGVRTINDKHLIWRDPSRQEPMVPPEFAAGARIGTGSVVLGGVRVGPNALVGAGAVVTRDVEPDTVVYGVPAVAHGRADR